MTMASVNDTLNQINKVLKQETSGPYSKYSCKTVSWDDVQRGTVGQDLSCWGSNITDTRLYAKDGRQLFTVRGDNWNERLGTVGSNELALIASHTNGGGGDTENLRPVTLKTLLSNFGEYGSYVGLPEQDSVNMYKQALDEKVSVRFQTTFLPVETEERGTLEFAPEAYNYNTTRDDDPRNLVLLCTTQGLALQQDGRGAKKLFHHVKDKDSDEIHRYWFEAESSRHEVGGSQKETEEEREDALQRGKATSTVIGTRAVGTRFNVLMTIQVPLKQQRKKEKRPGGKSFGFKKRFGGKSLGFKKRSGGKSLGFSPTLFSFNSSKYGDGLFAGSVQESESSNFKCAPVVFSFAAPTSAFSSNSPVSCQNNTFGAPSPVHNQASQAHQSDNLFGAPSPASQSITPFGAPSPTSRAARTTSQPKPLPKEGTSSAARVSRGSLHDTTWGGLSLEKLERHPNEHITATIVMYYACSGGVPTADDVKKAVDDLEELYQAVEVNGNLADAIFDFMKSELTVKDVSDIKEKVVTQPPPPIPGPVTNGDIFPM